MTINPKISVIIPVKKYCKNINIYSELINGEIK